MNDGARRTGGLDPARDRARQSAGVGGRSMAPRHERVRTSLTAARPMGRSISAPTIAGFWSHGRPATGSRHRRVLAHHPAGRGDIGLRTPQRRCDRRAVRPLGICRDKMKNRGVTRARLIATEACRAAANGANFAPASRRRSGRAGSSTARPGRAGNLNCTVDRSAGRGVILFDIGGGSSGGAARPLGPVGAAPLPQIEAWASLPIGVVSLAERHGGHQVCDVYEAMVAGVAVHVERFVTEGGGRRSTTFTCSDLGHGDHHRGRASRLRRYERRRVDIGFGSAIR